LFGISNAWGMAQSGTEIYKWNGTGFNGDTNIGGDFIEFNGGGEMTLLPGTGVLMSNATGTPFNIWFNGLIREEQLIQIQPGTNLFSTNYLSASIPEAGYITNITGYVPHSGDIIYLWNITNQDFVSYPYSNMWTSGTPSVGIGEGFVLVTSNSYAWTNSWQQCSGP
jgi:hypothetical protein